MEPQNTKNSHSNLKHKGQNWSYDVWSLNISQRNGKQNITVLTQKQKHKPIEKIWKGRSCWKMVLGKRDIHM
jgi:hypothetical protein